MDRSALGIQESKLGGRDQGFIGGKDEAFWHSSAEENLREPSGMAVRNWRVGVVPSKHCSRKIVQFLALGTLVFGTVLVLIHIHNERRVANEIEKLGGKCHWEFLCVRYVFANHVDDVHLTHLVHELEKLAILKSLSLYKSPITDKGVGSIERLAGLQWLYLSNTLITDECIPSLKKLSALTYLDLQGTKVSKEGMRELWLALPSIRRIAPAFGEPFSTD